MFGAPGDIKGRPKRRYPAVGQGWRSFLDPQEDTGQSGKAAGGAQALNKAATMMPNVVLMDMVWPALMKLRPSVT